MTHSSAARAAVEGYTRALARRVGAARDRRHRRRRRPLRHRVAAQVPRARLAGGARTVPLQRLGREHEHAWLVALCCSPLGAALSGSVVTLDGARDNWFGPWPPAALAGDDGEVPAEERGPKPLDRVRARL